MAREHPYDLVAVGGGAAGLAAASTAAARGARTVLVESGRLGGDCTWTGCVPSKTLIAAAARGDQFVAAMQAVREAVERIAATEDDVALADAGIDVMHGRARFEARDVLDVDGHRVVAGAVVVATGARPSIPPIEGIDDVAYLSTDPVFELHEAPASLAILGGGPTGCELAQAFQALGVSVTLVEALDRILATEEPEASEVIAGVLRSDGVDVRCGHAAAKVEATGGGARLHLGDGGTVEAERLLVVTGRRPATGDLGLEAVGVELDDRGHVVVDDRLATAAKGVWAAGDVTGVLPFTHAADEMGRLAVANALGRRARRFDTAAVPRVVFTRPEVASVGLLEAQAPPGTRVAELPMSAVDRAIAAAEEDGFVKLLAAPRRVLRNAGGGRIVGATIVASRAGELIHEPALAIHTNMFAGRLAQAVHAYPTWSIAVRQAAAQFFMPVDGREARPARRP